MRLYDKKDAIYKRLSGIFSVFIALYPLLSVYKSLLPGLDLATFVLLLFFLTSISTKVYNNKIIYILIYITIITPIMIILLGTDISVFSVISRYIKMIVSISIMYFFGLKNKYFDIDICISYIKKIIYICTVFIVIQRLAFIFGIVISNPFQLFSRNEDYINGYSMISAGLFRPSAFFLEPSHMANYCLNFLIISLFRSDSIKDSVVVTIAIICTGSGIGLVAILLIYILCFLIKFKKHIYRTLTMLSCSILIGFLLYRLPFIQNVINRFTTTNIAGGGNALEARIGNGYELFLQKNFLVKLLGSGYGNVPPKVYLNGVTYIINTIGIIGMIILVYIIHHYIKKVESWQKIGLLVVSGLSFVTQTFSPSSMVFYFSVFGINNKVRDPETTKIIKNTLDYNK